MARRPILGALAVLLLAGNAAAALDLRDATVRTLDNGLTVLVLEEPAFPLVSVQMVYRAGARDESAGRTGLAHFVEHMAFRGAENFPDTGLVSSIYAAGGEWHGYTYIDQTTYFATAAVENLDLLLRIEADRLARLDILPSDIPAERGAVLAEMHGYENDPSSVLHDATIFVSLLAHPYRNNTIGWESDVRSITHDDVLGFYERHYQPGNAVLAIVGDVGTAAVLRRVKALFADIEGRPPSALPVTPEPEQTGTRRIRLQSSVDRKRFQFVWHAPAARDADYPAFLLMQELLSGSSGVNFLHNDWGTPAREGSSLYGIGNDISTWMMPTAQPYVFVVKGSIERDGNERNIESAITGAVARLAAEAVDEERLRKGRERLLDELALDIQTTEDAAHQLAFFSGIDALDELLQLPAGLRAVRADDVRRVAARYLSPEKRTIGWSVYGDADDVPDAEAPVMVTPLPPSGNTDDRPAPPPEVITLSNGLPVILQASPLSRTVHLQIVLPGAMRSDSARLDTDRPTDGVSSWNETVPSDRLRETVSAASRALGSVVPMPAATDAASDPNTRLEQLFAELRAPAMIADAKPLLIVLAGDFSRNEALDLLEEQFGERPPSLPQYRHAAPRALADVTAHIAQPRAQARIGYLVPAPAPDHEAADAWRALQYILSHDYEGRLGKEAISRRGLVYYIDSRYRSDGGTAWVSLSAGVDPAKLGEMRELMRSELERLKREPPSNREVAEALAHRLGRAKSAAQSNPELSDALATQWLWYGKLVSPEALEDRLARVDRDDVLKAIDDFTSGAMVTVTVE